ncbi:MAG TPA: permease, partial [Candidatus Bathyarchaeia archaeon]|nr:permease [Candidatus Bathyarchaeia archaeon]
IFLFQSGIAALTDYVSAHVLFCLIPAFFLAGALNALVPRQIIVKTLGRKAHPVKSYGLGALFGTLVEVCSCTILPLFAGIWKRGAGLGPAITFLYAGPAINILAVSYTASLIGWEIALARLIFSLSFAILIGLFMAKLFDKEKKQESQLKNSSPLEENAQLEKNPPYQSILFFGSLATILIVGTAPIQAGLKYPLVGLLTAVAAVFSLLFYSKKQLLAWIKETWKFFGMIFPLLLVGVFGAGVFKAIIPQEAFQRFAGQNTLWANLAGVLFGVIAYFPALVEVPIAKTFLDLGMNKGPLLAYILADPIVSLQSLLVVSKVLGIKKTFVYALLITIMTTTAGLVFGSVF